MELLDTTKKFIEEVTSIDNEVKFEDLLENVEGLEALGIRDEKTWVFMIHPFLVNDIPYRPLNIDHPGLEPGKVYDLFSNAYLTVKLKDGEVEELHTTFGILERRVSSHTLVYPLKQDTAGLGFASLVTQSTKTT